MDALEGASALAITYYAASIIQAMSHRVFGHTNRISDVFESHALGHHAIYKTSHLLLDRWVAAERHVMWYFALLFAPTSIGVCLIAPVHVVVFHFLGLAFAVWWHVFLHQQYHLHGSGLERFHWFQKKRRLHFAHHQCVLKNYAIVEFWLDKVMGTYHEV